MGQRLRSALLMRVFHTRLFFVAAWMLLAASVHAQSPTPTLFTEITQRVTTHDEVGALALFDSLSREVQGEPRSRYLQGRLLESTGDFAAAATRFEISSGIPALALQDARERRAFALARSGQCAAAAPLLDAIDEGPTDSAALARALSAQCLLASRSFTEAVDALRRVVRENHDAIDTFAARFLLAEALFRTGDQDGAQSELHAMLVARPDHPSAPEVQRRLTRASGEPEFTLAQRLIRAERFFAKRLNSDVIRELDAAGRPQSRDALRTWLHLRGMALFRTRSDYAESAVVLRESAQLGGPDAIEDQFHSARALARSDQDARSIVAYRAFAREHSSYERAPEAEYLAAWLEFRLGRATAVRNMRRFLSGSARRNPSLRRSATWHLALHAFEAGNFRDAATQFGRYSRLGTGAMVRGRGLYWLGRARTGSGDNAGAMSAFESAIQVEPLHWYALLSQQRLSELGETVPPPFPAATIAPVPEPLPAIALPPVVQFYQSLGLMSDARAALERSEGSLRTAAPRNRGLEYLVAAYGQLGDASRPYRMVAVQKRSELNLPPEGANRWIWDAGYPRPYETVLQAAASTQGVPPEYLYAVMRQESGYNVEAVSHADAIGLLQMLPETSEQLAADEGVPFYREMLFDPVWNIRFAARYNSNLLRSCDGVVPLALASYNAGRHRTERWLGETGEVDIDLFVEKIPFDETRNYVRRVTTHYARYLYAANPGGGWPLALPQRVGPASLTP